MGPLLLQSIIKSRNFQHSKEFESSLPWIQEPAIDTSPELNKFTLLLPTSLFNVHFNVIDIWVMRMIVSFRLLF
jgi:hypothetical protein